jgi:effector-binding domain-containing protein
MVRDRYRVYMSESKKIFKIGDFARLSGVPIKTLRYYDEMGLFKPVKVDRYSNYRYYSVDQLPNLNRIIGLKNLGLSLTEVSSLLNKELPDQHIIRILSTKQAEITRRLRDYRVQLELVEEWLKQMGKEGVMSEKVEVKKLEKLKVASLRRVIPTYEEVLPCFAQLIGYLQQQNAGWAGYPITIFHDMEFRDKDIDLEAAVPIKGNLAETEEIKVRELPEVEKAVCIVHRGPYETSMVSYRILIGWLFTHGYQLAAPNREIYIVGRMQSQDPKQFVTELQFPIMGW